MTKHEEIAAVASQEPHGCRIGSPMCENLQYVRREVKCISSSRGAVSDRCRCISALCVKYWDPASPRHSIQIG